MRDEEIGIPRELPRIVHMLELEIRELPLLWIVSASASAFA